MISLRYIRSLLWKSFLKWTCVYKTSDGLSVVLFFHELEQKIHWFFFGLAHQYNKNHCHTNNNTIKRHKINHLFILRINKTLLLRVPQTDTQNTTIRRRFFLRSIPNSEKCNLSSAHIARPKWILNVYRRVLFYFSLCYFVSVLSSFLTRSHVECLEWHKSHTSEPNKF